MERIGAFKCCSFIKCLGLEMARAHDAHLARPLYRTGAKAVVSAHLFFLYLWLNQTLRGLCRTETWGEW